MHQLARHRTVPLGLSLAVALAAAACVEAPTLGTDEEAVVGGTPTAARPEVGTYVNGAGMRCTATLIGPAVVLTAAHCLAPAYASFEVKPGAAFEFTDRDGTGRSYPAVFGFSFATRRYELAPGGVFTTDVGVVHLEAPVPIAHAVPAMIAGQEPSNGALSTLIGFGCDDRATRTGAGIKRYLSFVFGTETRNICWGDSGGPVAYGPLDPGGAIWGLASDFDTRQPIWVVDATVFPDLWAGVVQYKRQLEDLVRRWDGPDEVGFDRPGLDYANAVVASVAACRASCEADGTCASFTYVPEGAGGRCWRKRATPEPVPSTVPGVVSGLARRLEVGINRAGGDFRSLALPSADACAGACARDASCASFTFAGGTCWLKNSIPAATACGNCTSGAVRRGLEPGVDRPGHDLETQSATSALDCANRCARHERCEAFTFTGGGGSNCWLKNGVPGALPGTGMTSGVRRGVEVAVLRTGTTLRTFATGQLSPLVCSAACAGDGACASWTYRAPVVPSTDATCFLYSDVGPPTPGDSYVSGVRGLEFQP